MWISLYSEMMQSRTSLWTGQKTNRSKRSRWGLSIFICASKYALTDFLLAWSMRTRLRRNSAECCVMRRSRRRALERRLPSASRSTSRRSCSTMQLRRLVVRWRGSRLATSCSLACLCKNMYFLLWRPPPPPTASAHSSRRPALPRAAQTWASFGCRSSRCCRQRG